MGIRFLCPNGHKLNVKAELAGRRGSCPECGAKLVIPAVSVPPREASRPAPAAAVGQAPATAPTTSGAWHLRTVNGEQHGPVSELQFRAWIAAGRVAGDSLVWREGWPEWKPARDVAELLPTPLVAKPVAAPTTASPPEPPASTENELAESEPTAAEANGESTDESANVDESGEDDLAIEAEAKKSPALATSTYVYQRQRNKQKQLTLAIAMLVAVVVLAGVLIWVVNLGADSATDASSLSNRLQPQPLNVAF